MSVLSVLLFIGLEVVLTPWADNKGLWTAFIAYVLLRGLSLYAYLPRLKKSFGKPIKPAAGPL